MLPEEPVWITPSATIEGLVIAISPLADESFPLVLTKLFPPLVSEIAPEAVSTVPAIVVATSVARVIFPVDCVLSPPVKSLE